MADHQRNKVVPVPKKGKASKKRRSKGNDTVDDVHPSSQWRSCLYGVVLRLDGVDVAKACFHMQNMVGSGSFFEELSGDNTHKFVKNDGLVHGISGFGIPLQNKGQSVVDRAVVAKDIIVRCLKELEANDELNGVPASRICNIALIGGAAAS